MQRVLTNCSLQDANIAFFPTTKRGVLTKLIDSVILGTCKVLGYLYMPEAIAKLLRTYCWAQGNLYLADTPLVFHFFEEDYEAKKDKEAYIAECHNQIMYVCHKNNWPIVWVFGEREVLEKIATAIAVDPFIKEKDSISIPIYFHNKISGCKLYALSKYEGEEHEPPKPCFINEKQYLALLN